MRTIATVLIVVMAYSLPAGAQVPISEQIAAAEHEYEMWEPWAGMTVWGCTIAAATGLSAEFAANDHWTLGAGALAGLTLLGIGLLAKANRNRLERKIETLKMLDRTVVAPLDGGAYVGYQVGW